MIKKLRCFGTNGSPDSVYDIEYDDATGTISPTGKKWWLIMKMSGSSGNWTLSFNHPNVITTDCQIEQ